MCCVTIALVNDNGVREESSRPRVYRDQRGPERHHVEGDIQPNQQSALPYSQETQYVNSTPSRVFEACRDYFIRQVHQPYPE